MRNRRCIRLLLTLAAVNFGPRGAHGESGSSAPPMSRMEKYSLVLLRRSATAPKLAPEALEALQEKHLAHLRAMHAAGKLAVAGPLDDQQDQTLRGVCLYRVDLAEARELAGNDPAVKAGRLEVEAMTWWVEKGAISFPLPGAQLRQAQPPQTAPATPAAPAPPATTGAR
jgi:uncharacterized protein